MKITKEHMAHLQEKLSAVTQEYYNAHSDNVMSGKCGRIPNDRAMRVRWDCVYLCVGSKWICDNLYKYANDDHIDTALRQIFKKFEENYNTQN